LRHHDLCVYLFAFSAFSALKEGFNRQDRQGVAEKRKDYCAITIFAFSAFSAFKPLSLIPIVSCNGFEFLLFTFEFIHTAPNKKRSPQAPEFF
jgi:hypothetical protein